MPLSDIATINVSTTGAGVTRAGYGVPLIISHSVSWPERVRTYTSLTAVGADFAANTPEYLAAAKIFGQSPHVGTIRIGRASLRPTQSYTVGVQSVATCVDYKLRVAVATGTVFTSQDATYNSAGATAWVPSGLWSRGDLVANAGSGSIANLYSCLGPSGAGFDAGFTGFGGASGPTGLSAAFRENGVFWMFVGTGNTGSITSDAIINGLKSRVEYLHVPTAVGSGTSQVLTSLTGSPGSRKLNFLGNAPGKFSAIQVYDRNVLNAAQDHADPGIATDLAAIKLANNSWYGLVTCFNSEPLVEAAQAWVEANTKLYPAASLDTQIATVAESGAATDVAHDTKANSYARSWVFHHPSPDQFADAAELGKFFPVSPGGETWRMKTLAGVTVEPYTDTEVSNMRNKNAQFYYDIGGVGVVGGDALTGSGEYIDVTRFLDWYTSELQAKLANLAIGLNKIPFTNAGIDLVEAKVTQQNLAGIAAGGIAASPAPIVTAPDVNDISTDDKQARELSGVSTTFELAGAIHHITVTVTANP